MDLEKVKENHSKVRKLKHPVLKMQNYLRPNNLKMKKDESQEIFRLRSRSTNLKINQRNKYETFECDACTMEDESQEHILVCKEILKMQKNENENEIPSYDRIFYGK